MNVSHREAIHTSLSFNCSAQVTAAVSKRLVFGFEWLWRSDANIIPRRQVKSQEPLGLYCHVASRLTLDPPSRAFQKQCLQRVAVKESDYSNKRINWEHLEMSLSFLCSFLFLIWVTWPCQNIGGAHSIGPLRKIFNFYYIKVYAHIV